MKAIMISIKPKRYAKILNGEETIEVRTSKALANTTKKLIQEYGYADIYGYCSKDSKNLLHKNCADIYWVEDKDFRNKNKQLGLQTQPILNGKVLFKFRCYKVEEIKLKVKLGLLNTYNTYETETLLINPLLEKCCLSYEELDLYLKWKTGYAIHISDLEIFDKPKELWEFESTKQQLVDVIGQTQPILQNIRLTKAPQNMVYIEEE